MRFEGNWEIAVYDEKATGKYPDCTDVEILEFGNWIRFVDAAGIIRVTSYPVNLRAVSRAKSA